MLLASAGIGLNDIDGTRKLLDDVLDDIRARKVDVIVVYKVDRLTRSLADFAKLVELFDAHGVSFVSVTQQFNTTTSMGRLTLNVLLSFAQFEREVTSERIRDKIAASKRKGLWVGGTLPFGYEMKEGKIAVIEEEAELVRLIFRRYLELGSVNALVRDLKERNIRTRAKQLATGATRGGIPFGRGALYYYSPWIRGAPHSALAMLISRISLRISGGTVGRPPRRLDFQRQYALKPARCQRMIVSGLTIANASHAFGNSR